MKIIKWVNLYLANISSIKTIFFLTYYSGSIKGGGVGDLLGDLKG